MKNTLTGYAYIGGLFLSLWGVTALAFALHLTH